MVEQSIGKSVLRKEDLRFITGNGRYTGDIDLRGQTYGYFVRSPYAHAVVGEVDTSEAQSMPGVVAVLTGKQVAEDELGGLPCGWMIHSKDGSEMKQPLHPVMAATKVNYAGEPVALVVADSFDEAKNAAEYVSVDYEELPAVVSTAAAQSGPDIYAEAPGNTCYQWELGEKAATDAAIEGAAHVTRYSLTNNRLIPNALEPRAAIADFNRGTEELTLYTTSQNPHLARLILTAFVQIAPEHKLRIIAPDVGGGFGSKIFVYSEETALAWASMKLGVAIKWTAERSESFLADAHGRDHVSEAELAMDEEGNFLALRVKTTANMGAYLSTFASAVPTYLYGTLLAGQYKTPYIYVEVDSVFTNTAPVDAYRGAGRPEATFLVERIVDLAAKELGVDPAELRRKNMIQPADFPYQTPVALEYDIGDYEASLNKALEMADYAGFANRKADSEANGKLRGIGLSCYIEACGLAPSALAGALGAGVGLWESGEVRVNPTGSVTVLTGTHSHGQGHETTFAQLVASRFGISVDDVEVVHGDTGKMDFGLGTYGSRSLSVGGSALSVAADKVVEKGRKIAAHLLEGDVDNIDFEDGEFRLKESNRSKTFQEIAFAAYVPHDYPIEELEPGLAEKAFYDPVNFTYPAGTHICEVEIDPETGVTEITKFTAVDDFGTIINPMIVEGQVHGGVAQGIGQAMFEQCVYDESGQLQTGSFMDYCMPRADDLPNFTVGMTTTVCTHNPVGAKGCGEAGAIGSPPAIINAITDAVGVRDISMPATPEKIWRAIQEQRA
ncbi:MAG: xanthine dehydrogenase family protein molybdopterin-binding subunit [Gammaproteobacteria bacterium]|jgi:carbon-monoxide dehydrogenase large subunit|nr:xanthine dehydrogenase family protein molybdopterin-binding subunit [Gammaproteobacteria bacterium]MBT3867496.1 xanthine dehydrogenase family protein molybdopterin-binding subunit [Gammaproteobacteria bacterium]MBT4380608.1 xanthine dehydrogenase family protein molybdopterin-binding subunit [Gammaproteobacteria bacterium]MBT4616983.1 xanthine dehydrogenase family protein molybdopterin-binding subunit [Gammaproteobacteria bacterium]MBT5199923.1 xanthine dehydrogenase family protein molybdopte